MEQTKYLKFVGKGLVDGALYTGLETDGITPVEILKGKIGRISGGLMARLLVDYPDNFVESNQTDFEAQNKVLDSPDQGQTNTDVPVQKIAKTPEEMEKEIQGEKE